jgi:hypothetical protein
VDRGGLQAAPRPRIRGADTQGIGLLIALLGVLMAAFGIRKLAVVRRRYKRDYLGE